MAGTISVSLILWNANKFIQFYSLPIKKTNQKKPVSFIPYAVFFDLDLIYP